MRLFLFKIVGKKRKVPSLNIFRYFKHFKNKTESSNRDKQQKRIKHRQPKIRKQFQPSHFGAQP